VTPAEAHAILEQDPEGRLVDVRTRAELEWVGRPPDAVFIEWNAWPGGARNPAFEQELLERVPDKAAPVLFLCRSGGRSHHAALAARQLGYALAFNILEGFEGAIERASRHRRRWKVGAAVGRLSPSQSKCTFARSMLPRRWQRQLDFRSHGGARTKRVPRACRCSVIARRLIP
jgi:rhodanese-related sulfurtransferase